MARAQERMKHEENTYGNFSIGSEFGTTRDKVGERLGISGRSYEKGKKVMEESNIF